MADYPQSFYKWRSQICLFRWCSQYLISTLVAIETSQASAWCLETFLCCNQELRSLWTERMETGNFTELVSIKTTCPCSWAHGVQEETLQVMFCVYGKQLILGKSEQNYWAQQCVDAVHCVWCHIHWLPDDNYFLHSEWSGQILKSKIFIFIWFQTTYEYGISWISDHIIFLCSDKKKNIKKKHKLVRYSRSGHWTEQNLIMLTSTNCIYLYVNFRLL